MDKLKHPFGAEYIRLSTEFCDRELIIETNHLAFQADGAVTITYGDAVVMGTAVVAKERNDSMSYFPLMIDYEEKMYAAGKISGSRFIKREGRASEHAVLTSRLIDRPIRPLFPKGFRNEVQGIATVLSADQEVSADMAGMLSISAALSISGAPFEGPVAGVRVGLIDDDFVANPTFEQVEKSKLDLVVAGTRDAIMMVEAGAQEVDEETMAKALEFAHEQMQPAIDLQQQLIDKLKVETMEYEVEATDEELTTEIEKFLEGRLGEAVRHENQYERHSSLRNLQEEAHAHFESEHADRFERAHVAEAFDAAIKREVRRAIIEDKKRPDNRGNEDIRPLSSAVKVLPKTHGSAVFTRGATQIMNVTTLASPGYAQLVDTMEEDSTKRFMHHYNFPPYSVGDTRPLRGPGRREIGHGALAERALEPVLPSEEDFPYTIRSVSEALSSAGSTSMGSVCSGCLSLMDAGVPITNPVSGIAMGLMVHDDGYIILSDIAEVEDFAGDMDFKVAGTVNGITALQMDIKVKGITPKIMAEALVQAKAGRAHILEHMLSVLPEPRTELVEWAPRIESITIPVDKIRDVIGKGGETINKIIEDTGVEIDIKDDGLVFISSPGNNPGGMDSAIATIKGITADPEIGQVYDGTVTRIMDFGAFVEILPGKEGMVHVSELSNEHVRHPEDVLKVGDKIRVKLAAIDDRGRLNLSKKAVDNAEKGE